MKTQFSPLEYLPDVKRSALLVIDIQERLVPAMAKDTAAEVIRNTVILLETAKEFGLPVMVSEQYPKGLGSTLPEIKAALPEANVPLAKVAFSCCGEESMTAAFEPLRDYDFIVCGMETHVCVLQTVLDLLQQGRRVYVAADAVCSRSEHNRQLGLDLMQQAGAVIGSTEIFAFGLLKAAGSDQFKRISKLVK